MPQLTQPGFPFNPGANPYAEGGNLYNQGGNYTNPDQYARWGGSQGSGGKRKKKGQQQGGFSGIFQQLLQGFMGGGQQTGRPRAAKGFRPSGSLNGPRFQGAALNGAGLPFGQVNTGITAQPPSVPSQTFAQLTAPQTFKPPTGAGDAAGAEIARLMQGMSQGQGFRDAAQLMNTQNQSLASRRMQRAGAQSNLAQRGIGMGIDRYGRGLRDQQFMQQLLRQIFSQFLG